MENAGFYEASSAGRMPFGAYDISWMVFDQNATRKVVLIIIAVALFSSSYLILAVDSNKSSSLPLLKQSSPVYLSIIDFVI